jgi:hypothetical protein
MLCMYCAPLLHLTQPQVLHAIESLSLVGDASTCGPSMLCTCAASHWQLRALHASRQSAPDRIMLHALMLMFRLGPGCLAALRTVHAHVQEAVTACTSSTEWQWLAMCWKGGRFLGLSCRQAAWMPCRAVLAMLSWSQGSMRASRSVRNSPKARASCASYGISPG